MQVWIWARDIQLGGHCQAWQYQTLRMKPSLQTCYQGTAERKRKFKEVSPEIWVWGRADGVCGVGHSRDLVDPELPLLLLKS